MPNWQQEPVSAQSRFLHKTRLIINNNLTEIYLGEYLCWSMLQCPHQSRVSFKMTSDCPEHYPRKLRITPRQVGGCSLIRGSNRDSRAQPAGDDSAIHLEKGSKLPGKMRLQVAVAGSAQGLGSATEVHNPLHIPSAAKVILFSFQNVLWAVKAILAACSPFPSQSILRKHP